MHFDIYDPSLQDFVKDGERSRIIGEKNMEIDGGEKSDSCAILPVSGASREFLSNTYHTNDGA